ncbi:MAG TPA: hypothetical protein VER55_03530 [Ardenticatenaceae bacterium]|nr:hypothetical protein [Ardenticatenaceae bacterium]
MTSQVLAVGVSNTVHILATAVWLGWSLALALLVAPQVASAYGPEAAGWLASAVRRVPPLAYLSLATLWVTGMVQLVANPNYVDLLALTNDWSRLIFVKHLAVLASGGLIYYVGAVVAGEIGFQLRAATIGRGNEMRLAMATRRFRLLAWLNLALSMIVLLMTGLATAIP